MPETPGLVAEVDNPNWGRQQWDGQGGPYDERRRSGRTSAQGQVGIATPQRPSKSRSDGLAAQR